jgi:uncharacterized membrane protein
MSDKTYKALFTYCDEHKESIKKGEYVVLLRQDYTYEQNRATIKVPDLDDHLLRIYLIDPATVYRTVNISDSILEKIRPDPRVLEVSLESGWGTKDDL